MHALFTVTTSRCPRASKRSLRDDSIAYHEELKRKGHLVALEALEDADTATTVRRRNGKLSMTDGPFAEIKEHLGGFFIIEARDLNEAIRIAGAHPAASYDAIEIRPVHDIPKPS